MKNNIFTAVVLMMVVILVSPKRGNCVPMTEFVLNKTFNAVNLLGNGKNKVLRLIESVQPSLSDLPSVPIIADVSEKLQCCAKDQDDTLTVPQIIRRHGFRSESHTVITEDGYLLALHRIPGNKQGSTGGQPLFLQHGLFGSSYGYMVGGGDDTLAYVLADAGYDVWLGNSRGNTYSRAHVSLCIESAEFWDFSWHEMAIKDLPAIFKYIEFVTGTKGRINYIGHSMGATMALVLLSELPQVAEESLNLIIALAPAAYMTNMQSPVRALAPFADDANWIAQNLGLNEFTPSTKIMKTLTTSCLKNFTEEICNNVMMLFVGLDEDNFNKTLLQRFFSHDPAGTSTKTIVHYGQEVNAGGRFQQFDYGTLENMARYGTPIPPEYNLSNVKVPLYLMAAEGDKVTSIIDAERLARNTNNIGLYRLNGTSGHLGFIMGARAYELVYTEILRVMQNYT